MCGQMGRGKINRADMTVHGRSVLGTMMSVPIQVALMKRETGVVTNKKKRQHSVSNSADKFNGTDIYTCH